jgi:hypothetical protein
MFTLTFAFANAHNPRYACGVSQGTPQVNATVIGPDVQINVSHRCFCEGSGGLQKCSSQYRADEIADEDMTWKKVWVPARLTIAVLLAWLIFCFEVSQTVTYPCAPSPRHLHTVLHAGASKRGLCTVP